MRSAATFAASGFLLCTAINLQAASSNLGNVVCIGDSITEGKNGLNVPPGLPGGYRQYLQNDLANLSYTFAFVGQEDNGQGANSTGYSIGMADPNHEGYGSIRIDQLINGVVGLEGHNALPISSMLAADAAPANLPPGDTNYSLPSNVLLLAGANDVLQGYDTNNIAARLNTLVGDIVAADPGATVYLASILPMYTADNPPVNAVHLKQVQTANAALPGIAAAYTAQGQRVKFVDQYATINPVTQTSDGIHPTYLGYQPMAQAWAQTIDETNRGLTTVVNTSTVTYPAGTPWTYGNIFVNSFNPDPNASLTATTATFLADSGSNFPNLFVSVDTGNVLFKSSQHLAALTIAPGATVQLTFTAPGQHSVLYSWQYFINNGTLDLTNNALDVQNVSLSAVVAQVMLGFNNSGGGSVISSTIAADTSHLTTLGTILNNVGGSPLYGNGAMLGLFYGFNPSANDVLVKYTYYGDANLDGKIDGSITAGSITVLPITSPAGSTATSTTTAPSTAPTTR